LDITFLTGGRAGTLSRYTERGQLMMAWMKEGMAVHGWRWKTSAAGFG
jgi:hypothetical protein